MAPMSPSSPGSEDSTLPLSEPGSDASDRSNGTSPAPLFSSDTGPTSRDGEMLLPTPRAQDEYERSNRKTVARAMQGDAQMTLTRWVRGRTDPKIVAMLPTSSSEASPASPSAPPAVAKPRTITAGSGPSSPVSFASLDPDGSWLRTYPDSSVQASLLGPPLERFYGTWPRSGSMRDGTVYAHPTLERPTSESGSSFLPTPVMWDGVRVTSAKYMGGNPTLIGALLHTPTTGDGTPRYDHRASPGYVRNKPVPNLDAQIEELLPTPKTPTGGPEKRASRQAKGSGGEDLAARVKSLGDQTDSNQEPHSSSGSGSIGDHTNQPSEGGSE